MKPGSYMLIGFGVALALSLGFLVCYMSPRKPHPPVDPVIPKPDTTQVVDSSSYQEPKPTPSPKVIIKEIPVPVFVADSTQIDSLLRECARLERIGDSLRLVLLRTQVHYADSTYDAWVSGVAPRLDSIKTYNKNTIITNYVPVIRVKKTRWGIGIQAGATIGKDGVEPYIGVGGSYNIITW